MFFISFLGKKSKTTYIYTLSNMTTQIDVVDINDNTNDNIDETPVEEIKPEEVQPKAKPRAIAMVKEVT